MPRTLGPWLICLAWFATVCGGFWWFEYRHWQSFNPVGVTFNGQHLGVLYQHLQQRRDGQNQITIAHFADQKCACNRYSKQHRKTLQPILRHSQQHLVNPTMVKQMGISVPASPAVAIWDKTGKLAYFGPYSSGMICGQGEDFVSRVVKRLDNNQNPEWINMLGLGCYCPWQFIKKHEDKQHA